MPPHKRLTSFSIKQKLIIGFGFMLLSIILLSAIMLLALEMTKTKFTMIVENDTPMVVQSMQLAELVEQTKSALGLYLLSESQEYKTLYQENLKKLKPTLQRLKDLQQIQNDEKVEVWLKSISDNLNKFANFKEQVLELAIDDNKNYPALAQASDSLNPPTMALLQALGSMLQEEENEAKRTELIMILHHMRYLWVNIISEFRAFLAYRSEVSVKNIEAFQATFVKQEKHIQEKFGNDLTFIQEEELETLIRGRQAFFQSLPQIIEVHSSDAWRQDAYLMSTEVNAVLMRIDQAIQSLVQYQQNKMQNANDMLLSLIKQIVSFSVLAIIIIVLVAVWGSWWLINNIVQPLKQAVSVTEHVAQGDLTIAIEVQKADEIGQVLESMRVMVQHLSSLVSRIQESGVQLTTSSTEIAATARQQESSVAQQAAAATQIMATSKMISQSTQDLADTMTAVTEMAEDTSQLAAVGHEDLQRMESSMRNMLDATASISGKLEIVKEKADNIGSVVTTITKIADQTNLLSLNAAIEAEKAGEYGLGFSVVATEIRRLADQTAVATWDIEQIVKEMQSAVGDGVKNMSRFSEQIRNDVDDIYQISQRLADIIAQVQSLIPHFETVGQGMQSHAVSAGEISESITELSQSARQTAESISHSNQAIQQLNTAARNLHEAVSIFKLNTL